MVLETAVHGRGLGGAELLRRVFDSAAAEAGHGPHPSVAAEDAFDRALAHFGRGRWSSAFEELVPLADAGSGAAARIALLVTTQGPRLFGQTFQVSPAQRERWQEAARRIEAAG
jgi:hypothetical protein